jgi:hypothetical protein
MERSPLETIFLLIVYVIQRDLNDSTCVRI